LKNFYHKPNSGNLINLALVLGFLEAIHGIFKFSRTDVVSSILQNLGRFLVGYWIYVAPEQDQNQTCVLYVFLTWSIAECARYPYYICVLLKTSNGLVDFLRYNAFIVFYPVGGFLEICVMKNVFKPNFIDGVENNSIALGYYYFVCVMTPVFVAKNYMYLLGQRAKNKANKAKKE